MFSDFALAGFSQRSAQPYAGGRIKTNTRRDENSKWIDTEKTSSKLIINIFFYMHAHLCLFFQTIFDRNSF
jgi:hypothetical protein